MKKFSVISIVIVLIAVFAMAFSFNDNKPAYSELTFHITGCPHGDCSNLVICVDGTAYPKGTCDFTIQVADGFHSFCIKCCKECPGKYMSLTCNAVDMYVPVDLNTLTKKCDCDLPQKK